jgi:1,4-alpha-glucan branching enzyme
LLSVFWAPHADAVFVIGSFNDWAEDAAPIAREDGGTWYAGSAEAKPPQSS